MPSVSLVKRYSARVVGVTFDHSPKASDATNPANYVLTALDGGPVLTALRAAVVFGGEVALTLSADWPEDKAYMVTGTVDAAAFPQHPLLASAALAGNAHTVDVVWTCAVKATNPAQTDDARYPGNYLGLGTVSSVAVVNATTMRLTLASDLGAGAYTLVGRRVVGADLTAWDGFMSYATLTV